MKNEEKYGEIIDTLNLMKKEEVILFAISLQRAVDRLANTLHKSRMADKLKQEQLIQLGTERDATGRRAVKKFSEWLREQSDNAYDNGCAVADLEELLDEHLDQYLEAEFGYAIE